MIPIVILTIENDDDRYFMTQLYLKHYRLLFSEVNQMISDAWTTEDIIQDSMIRFIDKIPLLRSLDERRQVNYLITTVRNQAKNYIRAQRKATVTSIDNSPDSFNLIVSEHIEIEDSVHRKMLAEKLQKIWPTLSDTTQEVLERKYILAQSDQEIAEAIGIKSSSVRMKLVRAHREAYDKLK